MIYQYLHLNKMKKLAILFLSLLSITLSSSIMAQKLKPSNVAPSFQVKSVQGEMISLQHYEGKTVLLAFFRFAACPVCNVRMHELITNYSALQAKNIEVIAVFESSDEILAEYVKDSEIPFPVISDPDLVLFKEYNTSKSLFKMLGTMFRKQPKAQMKEGEGLFEGKRYEQDGSMLRIPADFVIDSYGKIKTAHYGRYIGDHLPLTQLLE